MDSSATGDYTVLVIQIEGSTIPFFLAHGFIMKFLYLITKCMVKIK